MDNTSNVVSVMARAFSADILRQESRDWPSDTEEELDAKDAWWAKSELIDGYFSLEEIAQAALEAIRSAGYEIVAADTIERLRAERDEAFNLLTEAAFVFTGPIQDCNGEWLNNHPTMDDAWAFINRQIAAAEGGE